MPRETKVLQIRPSSSCENHCAFCSASNDAPLPDMTLDEVRRNLDHFIALGIREVVVSGGEVTCRPDFPELMALIGSQRQLLDCVTVISSGLRWTAATIEPARGVVDRIVLSLTPWSATDVESPTSQLGAVLRVAERLVDAGFVIETNTVVLRDNLALLRPTLERVCELGVRRPRLTFPFPFGQTRQRIRALVPGWEQARRPIFAAIDAVADREPRLVNLPLCYLGEYQRFCRLTTTRILVEKGRQLTAHAIIPPFIGKGHLAVCQHCVARPECDGFWSFYLDLPEMFPPLRPLPAEQKIGARPATAAATASGIG